MIYIERTITINESSAYIEDPIVLYKGDRNIEVQFIIKNSPFKHKAGIDLTYGQLVIKRPAANPIFSEVAKVSSSKVLFVITGDMIDELAETGNYDFQIRLLNSDLSSRATLPPITAGIMVKEPICEESVNTAPVNYSRAIVDREIEGTFDEEGNYNKTDWSNGDIITDSKLNKIEDALYTVNDSKATKEDIPTDVSAFTNDAGYLTEHQSLDAYALKADIPSTDGLATEQYVNDAIDNIDIPEPDLSNYATKDELPPIRVIGSDDPDNPYVLTGNEFTDEEYEIDTCHQVILKNVEVDGWPYYNDLCMINVYESENNGELTRYIDIYDQWGYQVYNAIDSDGNVVYDSDDHFAYNSQIDDLKDAMYVNNDLTPDMWEMGGVDFNNGQKIIKDNSIRLSKPIYMTKDSIIRFNKTDDGTIRYNVFGYDDNGNYITWVTYLNSEWVMHSDMHVILTIEKTDTNTVDLQSLAEGTLTISLLPKDAIKGLATKDELQAALGNIEDLLGGI